MTNEEAKRIVRDVIRFNNGFAQAHGKAGDLDADAILTALTAPIDDPEWDATDAAHPAWWRGNDRGVEGTCEALNRMLDHPEKPIGFAYDPLHTLAKRIRALTAAPGEGLYLRTFRHMHQAMYDMRSGELMDACRQCGLDVRDPIHSALTAPAPQEER